MGMGGVRYSLASSYSIKMNFYPLSALGLVLLVLLCPRPAAAAAAATLRLGGTPLSRTNRNYASWNVDSSYNRGFFHMNFSNPNLRAAAASLAPSTLRFGGTGNDFLHYADKVRAVLSFSLSFLLCLLSSLFFCFPVWFSFLSFFLSSFFRSFSSHQTRTTPRIPPPRVSSLVVAPFTLLLSVLPITLAERSEQWVCEFISRAQ